jgi:hypothetical protein
MKKPLTLLAALAISVGSLKAELSTDDLSFLQGWVATDYYDYVGIQKRNNVNCYTFHSEKYGILFVPTSANNRHEAIVAAIASRVTLGEASEAVAAANKTTYEQGYRDGVSDQSQMPRGYTLISSGK